MRIVLPLLACLGLAPTLAAQTPDQLAASQRASELMARGRFADAVPLYEKLVEAMPSNPGLRLNLAMSLHMSGQDAKAIPQFESVLKVQPNALPALMLLGASYLRMGSPAKAVPPLEKAVTLAPDDMEGRAMLADALLMLERYQQAIPHLRKLSVADPSNPRPWYGLGRCYEFISQRAFDSLEKLDPNSPLWLMLAADVRVKLGRNTAAFTLYQGCPGEAAQFSEGPRGSGGGVQEDESSRLGGDRRVVGAEDPAAGVCDAEQRMPLRKGPLRAGAFAGAGTQYAGRPLLAVSRRQ